MNEHVKYGLIVMGVFALILVTFAVMGVACLGVREAWRWHHAAGIAAGVVGVLVFGFLLGAAADWSDS